MKYAILSLTTLVLLACVCSGADPSPTAPLKISTATPVSAPQTEATIAPSSAVLAKVGDTVAQGNYTVTLVSMETSAKYSDFTVAKDGDIFLAVELIVQSGANKGVNVSILDAKVKDSDGFEYTPALGGKEPSFPTENDLPKGDKVRGWLTIEVPEKATGLIFTYTPALNLSNDVNIPFDLGR